MKRKEPTGTAAEDDGSPLLLVEEQEQEQEEQPSNFLTALPDLALSVVLDFLQEAAPTLRVAGMCGPLRVQCAALMT
jgi:hypothetical protein